MVDMWKGKQPAARLRDDLALEAGEIIGPGVARAHIGGGGGERDQFVRRNSDRRSVRIHMRMQVDEAGRDKPALGLDALLGLCRGNAGLDRSDLAEANADIADAAQSLARVDHVAVPDHQIEHRRLLAEGISRTDGRSRQCRRHQEFPS
jgi:hypothetical protein